MSEFVLPSTDRNNYVGMTDSRTDAIARLAARLIETGKVSGISAAVRQAAQSLGFQDAPLPGALLVRKHAQGMSMQSLGEAGYAAKRRHIWTIAEEFMSAIEHASPDSRTLLVGRAAEGNIDAGVKIHVRIYTHTSLAKVAASLVELGYDEPSFKTVKTQHGRLNQLLLTEDDLEIVLTRCLPDMYEHAMNDLFTGEPIKTVTAAALRKQLNLK